MLLDDPLFLVMLRKALHKSQEEFGYIFGLSSHSISSWERGIRKPGGSARILLKQIATDAKNQGIL